MLAIHDKRQIFLLLALLLGACGGGSDGNNVSSSPTPPAANGGNGANDTGNTGNTGTPAPGSNGSPGNSSGTTKPGSSQGSSPGGSSGGSSAGPGGSGGSQSPAPGNQSPTLPTPPAGNLLGAPTRVPPTVAISARWVSGDVLATMLTQQTRTANSIDDLRDAYPTRAAVPWAGPGPRGRPLRNAGMPSILAHQSLLYLTHTPGRLQYQNTNFWRAGSETAGAFDFDSLTLTLDLIVSLTHYRQNANEIQFDRSGVLASGTELLSIRDTIETRVVTETLSGRQAGENHLPLGNGGIYSIRQGAQIPYEQVLMRWGTDGATFSELLLLKGVDDNHARLCFNTHLPGLKRLSCTIWAVPAGWKLGQRLAFKGNYIVDDRSARPGSSGIRYWQTPGS